MNQSYQSKGYIMLFKSIKQLKKQLAIAPVKSYKQKKFFTINKEDVLKAATEVDNSKIFNMDNVKNTFEKLKEIGSDLETKTVLESINSLDALPFDNILFTFNINQMSPNNVIGAKNYIPRLPQTFIASINKLNNTDLLVYIFMDKFELSKRMMQPDHVDPADNTVLPKLSLVLQSVHVLSDGELLNPVTIKGKIATILYLDDPLLSDKEREDMDMFNLSAVTGFINLLLYYNTKPAEIRSVKQVKKGGKAKELANPNYLIDFSKPRIKYIDLPEKEKGSHRSPIEHPRASHYRHYKSGKVVKVKSTTVNKGNTDNSGIDKQYKL